MAGLVAIVALALFIPPGQAAAQVTRAEVIEQQQAEKRQEVAPPERNRAEVIIDRLEDWGLLLGTPRGAYPWFGSVYPGGGFAAGGGFRKPFGDDGAFNVFGGYSLATFARAQADVALPTFAQSRARITLSGRYVDAPDLRYFGISNSSRTEDQTRFGYTPKSGCRGRGENRRLVARERVVAMIGDSVARPPSRRVPVEGLP